MKLLYSGGSQCDEPTLKRLLLIGSELSFMDRPSVNFGDAGTIGHASIFRQIDFSDSPVGISVYKPPDNYVQPIYLPYAEADFENPEFARIVLEGIRNDPAFAAKFIQEKANYGDGITGRLIIAALARAVDLSPLPFDAKLNPKKLFTIDTTEGLQATLKIIMQDASVQVTSALVVADEAQAAPVADEQYFLRLLALRTSGERYVGSTPPYAWLVGLEFAKAVIPDEALQRLSIGEILEYRKKSAPLYNAWNEDMSALAARIDDLATADAQDMIPKLITTELGPKITAYRNEMSAVRDDLFAGVSKGVLSWKMPTLSMGAFAALGYTGALTAFPSLLVEATAAPIIDYVKARRKIGRKHAVSYLIGVKPD